MSRLLALAFAALIAGLIVMPAKYVLILFGVLLSGVGILILANGQTPGAVVLVLGVALLAFGVRAVVLEHRAEGEEARKASEAAGQMARSRLRR